MDYCTTKAAPSIEEERSISAMQPSWTQIYKTFISIHVDQPIKDISMYKDLADLLKQSALFKRRKNEFVTIESTHRKGELWLSEKQVVDIILVGSGQGIEDLNAMEALLGLQLGFAKLADYFLLETWPLVIKGKNVRRKFDQHINFLLGRSVFRNLLIAMSAATYPNAVKAQSTGPSAVVQTITTQLSQNAVVLCFGAILGSGRIGSALDHVVAGPLTVLSTAIWSCDILTRKVKDKLMEREEDTYNLEYNTFTGEYEGPANNWVMLLIMATGPWLFAILGLLGSIGTDTKLWWYVTACISFAIAELTRYIAIYTTYKGTTSEPCTNDHTFYTDDNIHPWDELPKIVEISGNIIKSTKGWGQLAMQKVDINKIKGHISVYRRWKHPLYAIATVAACAIGAMAAFTHMAAIVLSGASDTITGLWCLMISALATKMYSPLAYEPVIGEEELINKAKKAAAVALCFPETNNWPGAISFRRWAYYSILFPGERIKPNKRETARQLPGIDRDIDMHNMMNHYGRTDKAWLRVLRAQEYNGNSTWLEIADYMYTTVLYIFKHSSMCNSNTAHNWSGTCRADVRNVSLIALAHIGHRNCSGVSDALDGIRSFFDLRVYQYVLADAVGLEQIALAEVRDKIRSSNPATAAAYAVLMKWFGDTTELDDRAETLLVTAYLLSSSSVLGMAMSRAFELAHTMHGGSQAEVGPGVLKMTVADTNLSIKVAMHTWPATCPPLITETDAMDQPYLYAFILISMLKPARTLPSTDTGTRLEEIVEELTV